MEKLLIPSSSFTLRFFDDQHHIPKHANRPRIATFGDQGFIQLIAMLDLAFKTRTKRKNIIGDVSGRLDTAWRCASLDNHRSPLRRRHTGEGALHSEKFTGMVDRLDFAGIGDQPFQRLEAATKKSTLVALLERPTGATLGELAAATGWQCHSVRGFLSGTLTKMGRPVTSTERADGTPEGVTATICVSFKSSTQHRADSDCQGKVSQPSQRGDVPAGDRSRSGIKMRRASSTISERQTFSIRPETFA